MKRKSFLITLLMLVAVFNITPLMAQMCEPVEVDKWLRCQGSPGWSSDPPYYVKTKYYFWMLYEVKANEPLTDVVVYDRLGAELMIEGIAVNWATVLAEDYDYTFIYDDYERGGDVEIDVDDDNPEGYLDKRGLELTGTAKGDFFIFWTGNSVKAHFQWDVGDMDAGTMKRIWVIVSTDTNPAGWQEYTSCGHYFLNSGATVKALLSTGKQVSAVSDTIEIDVECDA